jgi:hypothetical protein
MKRRIRFQTLTLHLRSLEALLPKEVLLLKEALLPKEEGRPSGEEVALSLLRNG